MVFNTIVQFLLQTFGIALLAILLIPITQIVAYDEGLWGSATSDNRAKRDTLYNWSLIIPTVAMGANVLWVYRAVQRKNVEDVDI